MIAPLIAGLAAGIAFVVIFNIIPILPLPYYKESFTFPDPDYYSPLLQLRITGLKESYSVGEPVVFSVSQRAGGCVFPETILIKNLETGNIVWQFNSTRANASLFGCLSMETDPSKSRMTMNTQDEQPIIMNQAGMYALIASHQHLTIRQEFTVIPNTNSSNQTKSDYIELAIEGLKSKYAHGEPIVFSVKAKGFSDGGIACGDDFPPLVVISDDDGEEKILNPIRFSYVPLCTEPRAFDRQFVFGEKEEIVIDGVGSYTVTASYTKNSAITSHDDIVIKERFVIE